MREKAVLQAQQVHQYLLTAAAEAGIEIRQPGAVVIKAMRNDPRIADLVPYLPTSHPGRWLKPNRKTRLIVGRPRELVDPCRSWLAALTEPAATEIPA